MNSANSEEGEAMKIRQVFRNEGQLDLIEEPGPGCLSMMKKTEYE